MKILHTYCLNYNIGDYALGLGVKNLLRSYLDVDFIGETNLQGTVFNDYFIQNVVNKNYDLLVIGGGGIIHGAHWPNGWFWLIEEDLISTIKIPFVVYGAGYNYFNDEKGIPEIGKRHLRKAFETATHFSLRNDESVQRFGEQVGIEVPEVPDPGFHINLGKEFGCNEKEKFILVQLANDKSEHRFGSQLDKQYFIEEMRNVTKTLARKWKVIFSPHVFSDVELSYAVSDGIENSFVWDFSKYAFDNCSECLGYYQQAEFVLAMRGHGQIVPLAFDTPVISLENHPKHSGLMRKLGLEDYNVPVKQKNFADELLLRVDYLQDNYDLYVQNLKEINKLLYQQSKDVFQIIRNKIG